MVNIFPSCFLASSETARGPSDLRDTVLRGGFPEAVLRDDPIRRRDWFDTYVDALVQRDLLQISNLQHHRALPVLLSSVAAAAPGVLNLARLSAACGIPRSSLDRYVAALEQAFVVRRIPAWRVDAVLEDRDGRMAGIEVKLSESVDALDARHLVALRDATGDRWARGVVLHSGSHAAPISDRIEAWPLSWLWS